MSHGTFEPKINEVIGLREIMCHSVISIIHHYYIRVKKTKSNREDARKSIQFSHNMSKEEIWEREVQRVILKWIWKK